jgi:hypothetical protein
VGQGLDKTTRKLQNRYSRNQPIVDPEKEKTMKNLKSIGAAALCGALLLGVPTLKAADVKTYQVTGPVLEVTPTLIAVQKGKDRWEIVREPNLKLPADVKVGAKVTITYKMVAQEVEVKQAPGKK